MFYAEYAPIDQGLSPFVTTGQDSLLFPPSVTYKNEAFRLIKTYQIETPHQYEEFEVYCKRNNVELDVNLSNI